VNALRDFRIYCVRSNELEVFHDAIGSRDSSVGIATGCRLDGRGSIPGKGKNFFFSTVSRQALGPIQPNIQWVQGALSPGVKRPGHETDHSPSNAEKRGSRRKLMWLTRDAVLVFAWRNVEDHGKHQSRWPMFRPRFEPSVS
jgi:hypothetical protein